MGGNTITDGGGIARAGSPRSLFFLSLLITLITFAFGCSLFFLFPNTGMYAHVALCVISLLITLIDNLFAPWQAWYSAHRVVSESIFVLCIGLCFISYMLFVLLCYFQDCFCTLSTGKNS